MLICSPSAGTKALIQHRDCCVGPPGQPCAQTAPPQALSPGGTTGTMHAEPLRSWLRAHTAVRLSRFLGLLPRKFFQCLFFFFFPDFSKYCLCSRATPFSDSRVFRLLSLTTALGAQQTKESQPQASPRCPHPWGCRVPGPRPSPRPPLPSQGSRAQGRWMPGSPWPVAGLLKKGHKAVCLVLSTRRLRPSQRDGLRSPRAHWQLSSPTAEGHAGTPAGTPRRSPLLPEPGQDRARGLQHSRCG